jgi:hypothetical protein
MSDTQTAMTEQTISDLHAAGFVAASTKVAMLAKLKARVAAACEHYRYVRQEKIADFQERLKAATWKQGAIGVTYDTLIFTRVEDYPHVPLADVLEKVKEACRRGIFDILEVAHIVTKREVVDPIVFGRIAGSELRFFIAQWGDDVSIADILGKNDG